MKIVFPLLILCFITYNIQAQEIEAKLGGATINQGFSVKDNLNNSLFRVRGDGNVGIGLTSPIARMHILSANTGLFVQTNHTTDYAYGILSRVNRDLAKGFGIQNNGIENVTMYGNGNVFMKGNVGIGTAIPTDSKLAVDGIIKSKEVLVTMNGWPDFVFYDNYNLLPLAELEGFLKDKKHLPGIPSEREVIDNGLMLGDMQSKLLMKIEELTLYLIEQNKKILRLEKELSELRSSLLNETQ